MPRFLLPFGAALLPLALPTRAQPTPAYNLAEVHRQVQPAQLWPQVQGNWEFIHRGLYDRKGHHRTDFSYLTVGVQGRRALGDLYAAPRTLGFDAWQALVRYERGPGRRQKWRYIGAVRLYGDGGPLAVIPEASLQHRTARYDNFVFDQQLSVEHTFSGGTTQALESGPPGETWGRLQVGLEGKLDLTNGWYEGFILYPRLSCEAATHLHLPAAADPAERLLQYTALRAEVRIRLDYWADWLYIVPWATYQTRYLETPPQYNAYNTPVGGGKVNLVYPTYGLTLRLKNWQDRPMRIRDKY